QAERRILPVSVPARGSPSPPILHACLLRLPSCLLSHLKPAVKGAYVSCILCLYKPCKALFILPAKLCIFCGKLIYRTYVAIVYSRHDSICHVRAVTHCLIILSCVVLRHLLKEGKFFFSSITPCLVFSLRHNLFGVFVFLIIRQLTFFYFCRCRLVYSISCL